MSSTEAPSAAARLFAAVQHLLPQHAASAFVRRLTRSRSRPLKNLLIRSFLRGYRPDLREALEPDPMRHASFNEFFTRALRAGARPLPAQAAAIASPVDATVSQAGRIERGRLLQAKGRDYTVEALLASRPWAERFAGGAFVTLYLAPSDYHRIHMPLTGTLHAAWYVPGRLFSVNETTARCVPGLFARNERVICMFTHQELVFGLVLVGALFVGSMTTVWHGDVTPRRLREPGPVALEPETAVPLHLERGAEMGRFNMGSTVILLLPAACSEWSDSLVPGRAVRMGEVLGRLVRSATARDTR